MANKVHPSDVVTIGKQAENGTENVIDSPWQPPARQSLQAVAIQEAQKKEEEDVAFVHSLTAKARKAVSDYLDAILPQQPQNVARVRKSVRVGITILIFILVAMTVAHFARHRSYSEPVYLDERTDLAFEIRRCQLRFRCHDPIEVRNDESYRTPEAGKIWIDHYMPLPGAVPFLPDGFWEEIPPSGDTPWTFKLNNDLTDSVMDYCRVNVEVNFGGELGNINVTCMDECVIVMDASDVESHLSQEEYEAWRAGELVIDASSATSGTSTVRLSDIAFETIDIQLAKGDVFLEDIVISRQAGSSVQLMEGDLYAQIRQDIRVRWNESTSRYCLAAAVTPAPLLHGDCNATNTSANYSSNSSCSGFVHLCGNETTCYPSNDVFKDRFATMVDGGGGGGSLSQLLRNLAADNKSKDNKSNNTNDTDDDRGFNNEQGLNKTQIQNILSGVQKTVHSAEDRVAWAEYLRRPTLDLVITSGSFYVTRTESNTEADLDKLIPHQGASFDTDTGTIVFSDATASEMVEIQKVLENSATSGRAFVFTGPANARIARPGNSFLFTLLPSQAYASVKPWWLSWFCVLLLNSHQVYQKDIKLQQGPCPYTSVINEPSLSRIGAIISATGAPDTSSSTVAYIMNADYELGSRAFRFYPPGPDRFGGTWPLITVKENAYLLNQTAFDTTEMLNLQDNIALMLAFIISIVIGAICATVALVVFWRGLSVYVQTALTSSSHVNRYGDMSEEVNAHPASVEEQELMKQADYEYQDTQAFSDDGSTDDDGDAGDGENEAPDSVGGRFNFDAISSITGTIPKRKQAEPVDESQKQDDVQKKEEPLTFDATNVLLGKVKWITFYDLPPAFGMIEHMLTTIQKNRTDSLDNFLGTHLDDQTFIKKNDSQPYWSGISLGEFKNVYSKYCFLSGFSECTNRQKRIASFERHGFKLLELPVEEQKDAFIRLRFKTRRELDWEMSKGRPRQQVGESSLEFFLRASCKQTRFDTDNIEVDDFKSQYSLFCEQYRIQDVVTVSKALMQERKGISSSKTQSSRIVPASPAGSGQSLKLDMDFIQQHVESMASQNSGVDMAANFKLKGWKWLFVDIGAAALHMLWILFLGLYINLWIAFLSAHYSAYSTADLEFTWTFRDVTSTPSRIVNLFVSYPLWTFLATVPALINVPSQYLELLFYYWDQPLPLDSLRYFARMRKASHDVNLKNLCDLLFCRRSLIWSLKQFIKICRWCCHCYQWLQLIFMLYLTTFFLSMMAVWVLLAALINPESFLAYSTAVGTLIVFVSSKYAVLQKLYKMSLDEIMKMIDNALMERINFAIQKMVEVSTSYLQNVGGKALDAVGDTIGDVAGSAAQEKFEKHAMMLTGSSLGRNIVTAGFDIDIVVRLASGDLSALETFAEENGIPTDLVDIMIGLAQGDSHKVINAIGGMLSKYQNMSPIAPELAIALADLALNPSKPKAEKVTTALFRHGLPMMLKLWTTELGGIAPQALSEAEARITELMSHIKELQQEYPELPIEQILQAMQLDEAEREEAFRSAIHMAMDPEAQGQILNELNDLARDPQLRKMAQQGLQELTNVSRGTVAAAAEVIGQQAGLSPRTREVAINLLLDVLPPLLKGLVSLVKRDYHEFVTALVYVHNSLADQKPYLIARFGAKQFRNFERIRPILNMLDILMRTGSVQDSVFAILEDRHVLALPPEVITFTKFLLWLRAPTTRQDILKAAKNPMQIKFLCSWSARQRAIEDAAEFFSINPDLTILVEILIAIALDDMRALTFNDVGKRLARCAMVLVKRSGLELFKGSEAQEVLAQLFDLAMTLLVALQAGSTTDMFASLQDRTGIDSQKMKEVVGIFHHKISSNAPPPANMDKWHILQAAANFVQLEPNEAVGLAHLCFGHTETIEASVFIREVLRRQGVNPFGLDRFVKNLLAIQFHSNDQSVTTALQELQVRHRDLSMIGLHLAPPRYFSEDMLKAVGITDPGLLEARHAVPFRYEDNPEAWKEWIRKASLDLQGKPIGEWQTIDVGKIRRHKGGEGMGRAAVPEKPEDAPKLERLSHLSYHSDFLGASNRSISAEISGELSATLKGSSPLGAAQTAGSSSDLKAGVTVAVAPESLFVADAKLAGLKGAEGAKARLAKRREAARLKMQEAEKHMKDKGGTRKYVPLPDLPEALQNARSPRQPSELGSEEKAKTQMNLETPKTEISAAEIRPSVVASATLVRVEEISEKDRFQVLQLNWCTVGMNGQLLRFIIEYHNKQLMRHSKHLKVIEESTSNIHGDIVAEEYLVSTAFALANNAKAGAKNTVKAGATAATSGIDYQKSIAQRQLLNVQETSTGVVEQIKVPGQEQLEVILKILDLKRVVLGQSGSGSGKGKRGIAVKNFAEMIGVESSRLSIFFDLMAPERTQDARRAVEAIGKQFLSEHETLAIAEVAYTVKRVTSVLDDLRQKLWDFAHRFHLPRFLASAALLPNISYPPHVREIGSIAHFFFTPILMESNLCARAQIVLTNVMGLAAESPPNTSLLAETFGFPIAKRKDTFAVILLRFMMRKNMTDKLQLVGEVMKILLGEVGSRYPDLADTFNVVVPFMLFFCGFPFAELPVDLMGHSSGHQGNVFSIIQDKTGISKFVLEGIDLSQWSISPFSVSDENSFDCKSVLGLLLPMFQSARVSFAIKDMVPNDGIVKAIVSLAHCRTENLEYLAEALRLDTFLVQLLVQLVDLSRSTDDPDRIQTVLQSIHMNAGITKQLATLGIHHEKFLVLLSMSFPNMEDIAALATNLDKLGLARLGVDRAIVEFLYATVTCGLSHLRNVFDTTVHERNTTSLRNTMEPIIDHLGFHNALVPMTAIRLFQGYFNIFERDEAMMKTLLPSKLDRDSATGVAGILSYEPPDFIYHPMVSSGLVQVELTDGKAKVEVHSETHLPPLTPEFMFWIYDGDGNRIQLEEFEILVPYCFFQKFTMHIEHKVPRAEGEKEIVHLWWRAYPHTGSGTEFREEQRHHAKDGLRALEKISYDLKRVHWGGVAASWWFNFDVHPLFLLLAEGDPSAVRLASDLLGVPDVLLAFLLAHVSMAPAEHLRPVLLADLCVGNFTRRALLESVGDGDAGPFGVDVEHIDDFRALLAGDAQHNTDFEEKADAPPRSSGLGFAGERRLGEGHIERNPTHALGETYAAQDLREHLEKLRTVESKLSLTTAIVSDVGYTGSTPRDPHNRQEGNRKPQRNESEVDSEEEDDEEFDLENADQYHANEDEAQHDEDEPEQTTFGCMSLTDPQRFYSWTSGAALDSFPDELGEMYSKGEGVEAMRMGKMLSRNTKGKDFVWEAIAIDCLEDFRKYTQSPFESIQELHVLSRWFHRWRAVPNNLHLLLNLFLTQLYGLLDVSTGTNYHVNNLVSKAPTVSLILCLSKLSQARKMANSLLHHYQRVIQSSQLQAFLMPAMWGLEVHIRRGRDKFRWELKQDMRHYGRSSAMDMDVEDVSSKFRWVKGGIYDFGLPTALCLKFAAGHRTPVTSQDWLWEDWAWPLDHVTKMCCRVAQVARLAVGVAKPISCWHPLDDEVRLRLAMLQAKADKVYHEEPTYQRQLQRRGWMTQEQQKKVLDDMLVTNEDLNRRVHGRKMLNLSEHELKEDLLSTGALSVLWALVAGGANPNMESYSWKKVKFETKALGQYAHIYVAVASLISTDFGSQSQSRFMPAAGQAFRKILQLPSERKLGAMRVNFWAQTISAEIGLDYQTLEALVGVAHGFVQTEKCKLISKSSMEALAARLRMPKNSVPILQSICTKGWDYRSSKVLAARLRLPTEVLHGLIMASLGNVEGWIQLHNSLFRQPPKEKPSEEEILKIDWEQRMLDACCEFNNLRKYKRSGTTNQQLDWLSEVLDTILPILTTSVYTRGFNLKAKGSPSKIWADWHNSQLSAFTHTKSLASMYRVGDSMKKVVPGAENNGRVVGSMSQQTHGSAASQAVVHTCPILEAGQKITGAVGGAVGVMVGAATDATGAAAGAAAGAANAAAGAAAGAAGAAAGAAKGAAQLPQHMGHAFNGSMFSSTPKSAQGGENRDHELLKVITAFVLHILSGQNSAAGQLFARESILWRAAGFDEETASYFRDFSFLINHSGKVSAKDITPAVVENLAKPLTRFVRHVGGPRAAGFIDEEGGEEGTWLCNFCKMHNDLRQEWCEKCGSPKKLQDVLQRRMTGLLHCLFGMITRDNKKVLKSIRQVMVDSVLKVLSAEKDIMSEMGSIVKFDNNGNVHLRNLAINKVKEEVVDLMVKHSSMRALVMVQSIKVFTRLREERTSVKKSTGSKTQAYSLTSMARALHQEYANSFPKSIRNLWHKALKFGIMGEERLERVKFRELFEDEDILTVMKHLEIPVHTVEEVLDMFDPGDGTFNVRDMLDGLVKLRDRKLVEPAQPLFVEGTGLNPKQLKAMMTRPGFEDSVDLVMATPRISLAVGDKVVAKWPPYESQMDDPWFAATVTDIHSIAKTCSVEYEGGGYHSSLQAHQVYYAPSRDKEWGIGELRGNDKLPVDAVNVQLDGVRPSTAPRNVQAKVSTLMSKLDQESQQHQELLAKSSTLSAELQRLSAEGKEGETQQLLKQAAAEETPATEEAVFGSEQANATRGITTASSRSIEEVVVKNVSEPDIEVAKASVVPPLVGMTRLPLPQKDSPPRAWDTPGRQAYRPPALAPRARREQQAFNAMMHLFIGLACSDSGGFPTKKVEDMKKFLSELERSFLPILAGAATGRWEQVLVQLKELTVTLLTKADPELADDVQFVLDLLTLVGMDKELVNSLLPIEGGETGGKFLEVFIRRLTKFACEKLLSVEARNELVEIVDQLVRLLVVLCVDAPPAEVMARLQALITPLQTFLLNLFANDERLVNAAKTLLNTVYAIARDAGAFKASEYVDLFSPGPVREDGTREEAKAIVILRSLKELLLPFMPEEVHQPLLDVLRILSELSQLSADPTPLSFASRTPVIIEKLASVLCVPKHNISGIIALAKGDWAGATDLCRPFCNIDPEVLEQMSQILPVVRKTIVSAKDSYTSSEEMAELAESNSHMATRVRQIANEALRNKGTAKDLFELVDIDRNGTITVEEFELMMKRLGFDLNHHRVLEILSSCKKRASSAGIVKVSNQEEDGLTLEEFEDSLTYLSKKVAFSSMEQLLVSRPRLMMYLLLFTLILFLTLLFIFLGVNAFVTGGVFSSIVNSCMTLAAGISMSFAKAGQGEKNARDPSTFRIQLEEVTSTVFGQK